MDIATFRQNFTEFSDTTRYPESLVAFWLDVVTRLLRSDRWADLLDVGLGLALAHHLVLAVRDQNTAQAGKVPGTVLGMQTSKSVDTVSVSYDVSAVTNEGGGFWNMTSYGVRFLGMARMVGAGGCQL
tara:strand:+ start:1022 stop:1405 length:384 start_codon:yes stop_codon:yes gene_type:complete